MNASTAYPIEAATVFGNPLAAVFDDPEHSSEEPRELIVGHSHRGRVLVVSFAERNEMVRIISAREATPRERQHYEESPFGRWRHEW